MLQAGQGPWPAAGVASVGPTDSGSAAPVRGRLRCAALGASAEAAGWPSGLPLRPLRPACPAARWTALYLVSVSGSCALAFLPDRNHFLHPRQQPAGCPGKRSVCTKSLNRDTITTRNGTGRSRRRTRFEDKGKRERVPNTVAEGHEEAEE